MTVEFVKAISFAGLGWVLFLPIALMGIDILTGLINACWKEKNFESAKMRSGLAKKTGEIVTILIAVLFMYGMALPEYVLNFVSLYIIFMELMSVVENVDKLGFPWPKFIKDVINNVGTTIQNDDLATIKKKLSELEKQIPVTGDQKV